MPADDRGAGRAVDVVVAEHRDAFAGAHCARQAIGGQIAVGHRLRRRQICEPRREKAARGRLIEAAMQENLRGCR